MKNFNVTRRQFLSSAAVATGATLLPSVIHSHASTAFAAPAPHDAASFAVQAFPLKQVRLLDGPFKTAEETNRRYLHSLPNDRLLHMFRVTAGMPSSAEALGGWENPTCELRGHVTGGHYLSASAFMSVSQNDDDLKAKANALVEELSRCQQANGKGYLSAYPTELFSRLRNGKNVWAPFYTYHKIMAGHYDMFRLTGNELALQTAERMAGWAADWAKDIPDDQMQRILNVEYGGMQEVLANLYGVTHKEEYLALSHRFDHHSFFDPLADQQDKLRGQHANTHVPQVIGAARRYELEHDPRDRNIANYFWNEVTSRRCYCTGGTSNYEYWRTPPGILASQLSKETQECCVEYNTLKLTRHVYSWSGDPRAMDYYERTLFNSRLGTQDPSTGMKMYFLPLAAGYWKYFSSPTDSFWCCVGTGIEEFSKFGNSIYWHDSHNNLYVNLFIASELSWPERGLQLRQDTRFPEEDTSKFTIRAQRPVRMALKIRIPWWCEQGASVKVNGKTHKVSAGPSSYLALNREWRNGDQVEITLPMKLHSAPMPDNEAIEAVMYGPLVLAGQLGTDGLTQSMMYDNSGGEFSRNVLKGAPASAPQIHAPAGSAAWVETVSGKPLKFRTAGQQTPIDLMPLNQLFDQRYAVYWQTIT